MTTGVEIPVFKILAPVIGAALKRGTQSAVTQARLTRGGVNRKQKKMLELLNATELEKSFSLLSLYHDLPSGISIRDIEEALQSAEVQGTIKELMSASLADAPPQLRSEIRASLQTYMSVRFSDSHSQWIEEISGEIFDKLSGCCSELVERLQTADPEAYSEMKEAGQLFTMLATLDSIRKHLKIQKELNNDEIRREHEAWESGYRQQLMTAHGYIEPPDFDQKRKIPINQLYVSPVFATYTHDSNGGVPRRIELPQLIEQLDRTIILGEPGGGKSTVSKVITYRESAGDSEIVPFLVILRDLKIEGAADGSILEHINTRINSFYQCEAPDKAVESLLHSGRALVIFDGLDELLDVSQRREVTNRVELFSTRYPLAKILVTSRLVGYQQARLDPNLFTIYRLSGFTISSVRAYVENWFSTVDALSRDESAALAESFIRESETVPDLRRNPLMLALMCIIYRGESFIPKNRPAVYERCANLLYEKWDSSRQIHVELRAADYVDSAMKHLAYWMLTDRADAEAVSASELVTESTKILAKNFENEVEAKKAAEEFIEFCGGRAWVFSDAGSTGDGELLYKFTHRTFMEYFAAYHLTRIINTPEDLGRILLPRIGNQEWDVVAQLALQIFDKSRSNGAERVFTYMLNDRRRRSAKRQDNIAGFIARCMGFIPVSHEFARTVARQAVSTFVSVANARKDSTDRIPTIRGISSLVAAREEAIPPIQTELDIEIARMFEGSETERLAARSIVAEFELLPEVFDIEFGGSISKKDTEHWTRWARDQFRKHRDELLVETEDSQFYWLAAVSYGIVTMSEYLTYYNATHCDGCVLDALFSAMGSELFQSGYGPPVRRYLLFALHANFETDEIFDAEFSKSLLEISDHLGDSLDPPLVSAALGDPHSVHHFVFWYDDDIGFRRELSEFDAIIAVLFLATWELLQTVVLEGTSLPVPRELRTHTAARSGSGSVNDVSELSELTLTHDQRALLKRWACREVDFVAP